MSFTDINHFSISLSFSYWNITGKDNGNMSIRKQNTETAVKRLYCRKKMRKNTSKATLKLYQMTSANDLQLIIHTRRKKQSHAIISNK